MLRKLTQPIPNTFCTGFTCIRHTALRSLVLLFACLLPLISGCNLLLPDVSHQPVIHNPFPQISKVAIVPFFNHTQVATVNGRQFAEAYFAELQTVPGFEVVPVSVVEQAILAHRIEINGAESARRLANILGVDAVVLGTITDFSNTYPPRCGLHVEWYAANPSFHKIPAGYGLPWGTPDEEYIPAPLVFEAELALAREQMKTQTPNCPLPGNMQAPQQNGMRNNPNEEMPRPGPTGSEEVPLPTSTKSTRQSSGQTAEFDPFQNIGRDSVRLVSHKPVVTTEPDKKILPKSEPAPPQLPPNWPDERGFIPPGPSLVRPPCLQQDGPIMTHTRIYRGNDSDFTEALASYTHFRDDARLGGWQSYLERSDDFIRFCCHLHISEMLSARGGAGETRVVWRWSDSR